MRAYRLRRNGPPRRRLPMPTTAHQAPPGMSGEGPDALYSKGGDERSARTGRRPTLMQAKSHMINIHHAGKKPIIWLTTCARNGGITAIRSIARSQSNRCDIIHTVGGQFSLMVERDTVAACRSLARGARQGTPYQSFTARTNAASSASAASC